MTGDLTLGGLPRRLARAATDPAPTDDPPLVPPAHPRLPPPAARPPPPGRSGSAAHRTGVRGALRPRRTSGETAGAEDRPVLPRRAPPGAGRRRARRLAGRQPRASGTTTAARPHGRRLDDDLRVWTGEEAARFLAFVDDHPWRALWHLALGTGARRGELLGLRWVDIDLVAAEVRIRRSLSVVDGVARLLGTKTSPSRTLSIGDAVVSAVRRHRDEQAAVRDVASRWEDRWGLVFTEPNGASIDPMRLTNEFRELVRRAPLPVIRLHDLRHTHASLLLAAGVPIKVVSERLGHTTIAMTMDVYGHVLPAMDADAAARLDVILRAGRSEAV